MMIKDITITIGKKDIKLSMKEVKQLRKELNDLVEKETVKEFISYPVYPAVYPDRPYQRFWYDSPTVTCGTGQTDLMTGSHSVYVNGEMTLTDAFISKN